MAKTKSQKSKILEKYSKKIGEAKGVLIVKAQGLTPNEVNSFRKNLYDVEAKFNVVKNTLFKLALKDQNLEEEPSLNSGNHAVLFTKEDIVTPAKNLKEFIKTAVGKNAKGEEYEKIQIVGGYLDGKKMTLTQVIDLADTPSKQQSVSMILGILDMAISGVLNVIEDSPRSIVSILDQAYQKK